MHRKFYGDRPRGINPSDRGVKPKRRTKNITILDLSKAISRKRVISGKPVDFGAHCIKVVEDISKLPATEM